MFLSIYPLHSNPTVLAIYARCELFGYKMITKIVERAISTSGRKTCYFVKKKGRHLSEIKINSEPI